MLAAAPVAYVEQEFVNWKGILQRLGHGHQHGVQDTGKATFCMSRIEYVELNVQQEHEFTNSRLHS